MSSHAELCPVCRGAGGDLVRDDAPWSLLCPPTKPVFIKCKWCAGTGEVVIEDGDRIPGSNMHRRFCRVCGGAMRMFVGGDGWVTGPICTDCRGEMPGPHAHLTQRQRVKLKATTT